MAGGDALRDDGAAAAATDVDHLRAGVGLLVVVRERHRVELADRVRTGQHAARVLPGDRRAGLDLRPADARVVAAALAALGDEVVDPATALLVAGIPVLHRRILDRRTGERHELDHRGVQLVLVAHRGRTALQVAHVAAFVGDDQRPLELPGVGRVDPEIRRELHRTAHPRRHVDERPIGKDGGIQGREEIVRIGHYRPQITLDDLGMLTHCLGERAEQDARLREPLAEGGRDRDTVEHRVDGDAREARTLVQRHAELLVGGEQFRVDIRQALRPVAARTRRRVVGDGLIVDVRDTQVRPRPAPAW